MILLSRLSWRWALPSLFAILLGSLSQAQAPSFDWASGFEAPGFDGPVYAIAQFDDGSGSAVYVGGDFTRAGATNARWIARWDGRTWSAVGEGFGGYVRSLAVFDDGTGPALYVGGDQLNVHGQFAGGIARGNGSTWSMVGVSTVEPTLALVVHDDGSGPALFAGGGNNSFGSNVAKWDGATWTPLGSGCTGNSHVVNALAVFDDGTGPALAAGGDFTYAGGVAAQSVARWDGSAWSAIDLGLYPGPVRSLTVADVGSGPSLFASGEFSIAGVDFANRIARWDGTYWRAMAEGLPGGATALRGYAGNLYAGGSIGRGPFLRRWNGARWSDPGALDEVVECLEIADDGGGPQLYVGGSFDRLGSFVGRSLVRLGPAGWNGVFAGNGLGDEAYCSTTLDLGSGTELYVGGRFRTAGRCLANGIARWNGSTWSALQGDADGYVFAIAASAQGPGGVPELYAGGLQTVGGAPFAGNLGRWDGSGWSSPGGGLSSSNGVEVDALFLTSFGPGPGTFLYAGGEFEAAGGAPASNIARWDGSAWSALGSGLDGQVRAMTVFDDGSGPALFVGGHFTTAGGVPAADIVKWDGASWTALGSGIGGYASVHALAVFDGGSGPELYVGGEFIDAGGIACKDLARWNGSSWSDVPGMLYSNGIHGFVVHDDGHGGGPALYVCGSFSSDNTSRDVERWTGTRWETLRTGITDDLYASNPFPKSMSVAAIGAAPAPTLYVIGSFHTAGLKASDEIAEWASAASVGSKFCTGDGRDPRLSISCPCGNLGVEGHGCANSANPDGGELDAVGSVLADPQTGTDTVQLIAEGMGTDGVGPDAISLFVQGSQGVHGGVVLGDGVRCVGGAVRRIAKKQNFTGGARYPEPGELSLSKRGGVILGSGVTRVYQVLYRDPTYNFCRPDQLNVTNGLRIVW